MRFPSPFHSHLPSHCTNARPVPAFLGYWLAPFCAIVLTEHFLFRRSYSAYDVFAAWNVPTHPDLPHWWPSLATFAVAVCIIVLCMEQAWGTGPIAARGTGDIGMLVGFGVSALVFAGTRALERRLRGRASSWYGEKTV